MSKKSRHHDRMDELLEGFKEKCHEELDKALTCGALTENEFSPNEYALSKIVLTLVGEAGHWKPIYPAYNKELKNLSHFIG